MPYFDLQINNSFAAGAGYSGTLVVSAGIAGRKTEEARRAARLTHD